MTLELKTPAVDELGAVVAELSRWQSDEAPLQLHPGDIGWFERYGTEATAAAVRTWSQDGQLLAIGLLDGADLLRMTLAPQVHRDQRLAEAIAADIADPERGVLPVGAAVVEAPTAALVKEVLADRGWAIDEPWTPLRRDLGEAVADPDLRVEVVGPDQASDWAAIVRSAFGSTTFTEQRWHAMSAGVVHADAQSLLGYDDQGAAVATITVWSAGPGRPGLIEPMGVHTEHRGHGYGRSITVAAARALRDLGASSALVCTESSRVGAVATYRSAGFQPDPERTDRRRGA
ncbi:GNAT family N-acetyltransferase [Ruania zhangjianzhongii]|uniref:GNAT family N-acetyltransferase n=1 Tax=Ruania zhangjianzhongii TaxID=2603206 RepID=UPI0011C88494|nr:GNAT family N-acetyltransferase [Ruania zhangjianzhongii]